MGKERGLYRSDNRVLGGVCAGFAEYFDFDITLTRIIYAVLTFGTAFSGVLVYLAAWIVMPSRMQR